MGNGHDLVIISYLLLRSDSVGFIFFWFS